MLFVFRCLDDRNAGDLRQRIRPEHLQYLAAQKDRVVLAGALLGEDQLTPVGSLLVVSCDDLAAARTFSARDPYALAGLFTEVSIQPFRQATL